VYRKLYIKSRGSRFYCDITEADGSVRAFIPGLNSLGSSQGGDRAAFFLEISHRFGGEADAFKCGFNEELTTLIKIRAIIKGNILGIRDVLSHLGIKSPYVCAVSKLPIYGIGGGIALATHERLRRVSGRGRVRGLQVGPPWIQ